MQLTFIGTRGEIDARTRRHRMHTSLLVSYRSADVMIDCGFDWLGRLNRVDPSAIVLTHAHPDHAWELKRGAPCPVYAPERTWQELLHYPINERRLIKERTATKICGITFEAFPVEHSILSPAGIIRIGFSGGWLASVSARMFLGRTTGLLWRAVFLSTPGRGIR
jgi:phosphoribosyl 1,2-cyclic phosphodiesterase